jgi:hypothetical protein
MARVLSRRSLPLLSGISKYWRSCGLVLVAGLAVTGGCDSGGGTGVVADYALSLTPAALTIDQGANGNTTVTITRTDFTGAVTLSLGGAPAGVTRLVQSGGSHRDQLHAHGERGGHGGSRRLQPDRGRALERQVIARRRSPSP